MVGLSVVEIVSLDIFFVEWYYGDSLYFEDRSICSPKFFCLFEWSNLFHLEWEIWIDVVYGFANLYEVLVQCFGDADSHRRQRPSISIEQI